MLQQKKYVDDKTVAPDLSDYLEKDGTVTMTGNLNVGNNKIINLSKPTQDNEAVNKDYADKLVHHIMQFNQVITTTSLVILCQVRINGRMK